MFVIESITLLKVCDIGKDHTVISKCIEESDLCSDPGRLE